MLLFIFAAGSNNKNGRSKNSSSRVAAVCALCEHLSRKPPTRYLLLLLLLSIAHLVFVHGLYNQDKVLSFEVDLIQKNGKIKNIHDGSPDPRGSQIIFNEYTNFKSV